LQTACIIASTHVVVMQLWVRRPPIVGHGHVLRSRPVVQEERSRAKDGTLKRLWRSTAVLSLIRYLRK